MKTVVFAVSIALIGAVAPARAEVTPTDLQVAARALTFMERPLNGPVRVGILHSPSSPRSLQEAQALQKLLGAGMRVGTLELHPVLVTSATATTAGVDLLFMTEHTEPHDAQAAVDGMSTRVPCVTTDVEKVRSGLCLMAVRSRPKVEIIVSRAVTEASGVKFATVFRVMITEI